MTDFERAGSGLNKIAQALLRGAPADESPLLAWPLACGAQVAGKTRALRFDGGVLTVEVPDETWRGQLRDMAANYVRSLKRLLDGRVERIEFVTPANSPAKLEPR